MTFDWIEVTWTAISIICFTVKMVLVGDSWTDVKLMTSLGHRGRRWVVAVRNFQRELVRAYVQSVFVLVGFASMFMPPRSSERGGYIIIVLLFLSIQFALLWSAVMDYRARWKLRHWESGASDG